MVEIHALGRSFGFIGSNVPSFSMKRPSRKAAIGNNDRIMRTLLGATAGETNFY
jgi:hypothetical protein